MIKPSTAVLLFEIMLPTFFSNMDIILHLLIYFFFNANNFYIVRKFCAVTNSVFTSWLVHDDSLQKKIFSLFTICTSWYREVVAAQTSIV